MAQEKAQSTRVFLGRVSSIEERTDRDFPYKRVSFVATETFKGTPTRDVQLTTGMGDGDCGYFFETGQEYVVYAYGKEDELVAGYCSLTGSPSDPRSGLEELRDGS